MYGGLENVRKVCNATEKADLKEQGTFLGKETKFIMNNL